MFFKAFRGFSSDVNAVFAARGKGDLTSERLIQAAQQHWRSSFNLGRSENRSHQVPNLVQPLLQCLVDPILTAVLCSLGTCVTCVALITFILLTCTITIIAVIIYMGFRVGTEAFLSGLGFSLGFRKLVMQKRGPCAKR